MKTGDTADRLTTPPRRGGPSAAAQSISAGRFNQTGSAPGAGLTVGVLVEQRYLAQRQPASMMAALAARGCSVRLIDPQNASETGDDGWLRSLDIVVARGRSQDLLNLLAAAESHGLPALNSHAAISAVHNKVEMTARLAAGRLPMPRTYIDTMERLAARLAPAHYPLIVKPIFGDNARGIQVFQSADELRAVQSCEPVIGQRFLDTDGFDVKLYAIGYEVWVVRKPSPLAANTSAEPELLPLTREAYEIARRCGKVFGLQLYGVDCVATPRGLAVIEVNDYPNYSGVPQAGERLARHVEHCLDRERTQAAL